MIRGGKLSIRDSRWLLGVQPAVLRVTRKDDESGLSHFHEFYTFDKYDIDVRELLKNRLRRSFNGEIHVLVSVNVDSVAARCVPFARLLRAWLVPLPL